jgi:hypothetical protein
MSRKELVANVRHLLTDAGGDKFVAGPTPVHVRFKTAEWLDADARDPV